MCTIAFHTVWLLVLELLVGMVFHLQTSKDQCHFNLELPGAYVCFCVLGKKTEKANFSCCPFFSQSTSSLHGYGHMCVLT